MMMTNYIFSRIRISVFVYVCVCMCANVHLYASIRFDGMVGGRPHICQGLFNNIKMRLMMTDPRALTGSGGIL